MFVLIYTALGAADLVLMLRYARKGLGHEEDEGGPDSKTASGGAGAVPALTY